MPAPLPRALRLPLPAVAVPSGLTRHVVRALRPSSADLARTVWPYAFKSDERSFALALLRARTQLWLFRAHQAASCGDFLVVDLSDPSPSRRPVWALELKRGRPLRVGAGFQGRNVAAAVGELVRDGVVGDEAPVTVWTADARALLARFGVGSPEGPERLAAPRNRT